MGIAVAAKQGEMTRPGTVLAAPAGGTQEARRALEMDGLLEAAAWTLSLRMPPEAVLSEQFVRVLHKRMFGRLYRRAGTFRQCALDSGLPPAEIPAALGCLLQEGASWVQEGDYDADETAVRVAHRLARIRSFDLGNARHARLFADVLLQQAFHAPPFTWGSRTPRLSTHGARARYLEAMSEADAGEMEPLLLLARS